jgi:hypothetical protein
MRCKDCDEEIKKREKKGGYANQCDACALEVEDEPKYLGFNDGSLNKSTNISVYRGNDPLVIKSIKHQKNRVG